MPGRIAQSVTCLATDACLTADPGVFHGVKSGNIGHQVNSDSGLVCFIF